LTQPESTPIPNQKASEGVTGGKTNKDTSAPDTSLAELRAKAESGDREAQHKLGLRYDKGEGVKNDDAEAVKWYRKAAEQGFARSQLNLARFYYRGRGVTRDYVEAAKWYRKAAEQNNAGAQYSLGHCYANGEGLEKDMVEAYKWTLLAAGPSHKKGQEKGQENAKEYLPTLEGAMTPEQRAEGKRRADEWRKQHNP